MGKSVARNRARKPLACVAGGLVGAAREVKIRKR